MHESLWAEISGGPDLRGIPHLTMVKTSREEVRMPWFRAPQVVDGCMERGFETQHPRRPKAPPERQNLNSVATRYTIDAQPNPALAFRANARSQTCGS